MSESSLIVLCGSIALDRIMNFAGSYKDMIKPDKIHVLSISVLLSDLQETRGGVAGNIAYSLALLGEKPILLGSVGKNGKDYLRALKRKGINIDNVHISRHATASFNVITDQENNQVGGFFPGAMFDSDTLSFGSYAGQNIFAVISPHDPKAMKRQVRECNENNIRMLYDVGQQVSNIPAEDIIEGVNTCEVLIVNDYELAVIAEKTKQAPSEIKKKIPVVITTLGAEGSVIEGKNVDKKLSIGIAETNHVIDPTGAGDAYRAGFLFGYVRNWNLKICGQMGAVASSFAIEKAGTQKHKFTKKQFLRRFQKNFHGNLDL